MSSWINHADATGSGGVSGEGFDVEVGRVSAYTKEQTVVCICIYVEV